MSNTGLLKPGTPINEETINEAIEKIALACAHGVVQRQVIVEFISKGHLSITRVEVPGPWKKSALPGGRAVEPRKANRYGDTRLATSSWVNLKKRLKASGFVVKDTVVDRDADGSVHGKRVEIFWGSNE